MSSTSAVAVIIQPISPAYLHQPRVFAQHLTRPTHIVENIEVVQPAVASRRNSSIVKRF